MVVAIYKLCFDCFEWGVLVLGIRDVEDEGLFGRGGVGVDVQNLAALEITMFWMSKGKVV